LAIVIFVLRQVQAVVVGLLAAIFAMMLGWIPQRKFSVTEGLLLCASSVITAALASFILGIDIYLCLS
jgi:solute carrier family 41